MNTKERVGIYVDAVNVTMNGGYGLRYDTLRMFACRGGGIASRLNVYLCYDSDRLKEDHEYRQKTQRFCEVLRDFEYKVTEKPVQTYTNHETGEKISKSTIDMDMAVDMLVQADHLDKIVLLSSSGSYVSVVNAIQNKGCRVELVGFNNVSSSLKRAVDSSVSGYLIPGLLPIESPYEWGENGSRVRGVCYDFSQDEGYGFLRFLTRKNDCLWITDSRDENSPYKTVFAHVSQFEEDFDTHYLPSRELIFEFDVTENDKGLIAESIVLVSAP
ncbi:NYN domain-containing protein [Gracilimonas sediminicola]|uniref:NYN domain-containing protein n=1 Tax=Gracilimonas sediminicola TaxID=2952158 RepID=UPI0038D48769